MTDAERREKPMFAVAIRDGQEDLFLWIRIRRSRNGDVFCMRSIGGEGELASKWNPHWSHHKSGRFHYKSFGKKRFSRMGQTPDSDFRGAEPPFATDIRSDDLRDFGVICNPKEFCDVMEVPATLISPANPRETFVSLQLTEPGGQADIADGCEILLQKAFNDTIPVILVSVCANPP
jgi:hypothetical protein